MHSAVLHGQKNIEKYRSGERERERHGMEHISALLNYSTKWKRKETKKSKVTLKCCSSQETPALNLLWKLFVLIIKI